MVQFGNSFLHHDKHVFNITSIIHVHQYISVKDVCMTVWDENNNSLTWRIAWIQPWGIGANRPEISQSINDDASYNYLWWLAHLNFSRWKSLDHIWRRLTTTSLYLKGLVVIWSEWGQYSCPGRLRLILHLFLLMKGLYHIGQRLMCYHTTARRSSVSSSSHCPPFKEQNLSQLWRITCNRMDRRNDLRRRW